MSITVRVISAESDSLLALHLRRIGRAGAVASDQAGFRLLVTGLSRAALAACAGLPGALPGDPERAPGTLLLWGQRTEFQAAAERLDSQGGELSELARTLRGTLARQARPPAAMQIGRRTFEWGSRTFVMGIVNVTPDSFSDGGRHLDADAAVAAGERMVEEGADLLDVGGESTRPGADPVPVQQELDRVLPVIERLAKRVDAPLSVDTTKAAVAEAALRAGASLVNDVSGFVLDPEMAPTCARHGAAACAMHMRGTPRTMQQNPTYLDVVGEVLEGLAGSLAIAARCGLPEERLVLDPGIGFGKTAAQNLFLLRNVAQLRALGRPLLVGASRKSFLGVVTGRPVDQRLSGSLAVATHAALAGVELVRVHDVSQTVLAVRVAEALREARDGGVAYLEG